MVGAGANVCVEVMVAAVVGALVVLGPVVVLGAAVLETLTVVSVFVVELVLVVEVEVLVVKVLVVLVVLVLVVVVVVVVTLVVSTATNILTSKYRPFTVIWTVWGEKGVKSRYTPWLTRKIRYPISCPPSHSSESRGVSTLLIYNRSASPVIKTERISSKSPSILIKSSVMQDARPDEQGLNLASIRNRFKAWASVTVPNANKS